MKVNVAVQAPSSLVELYVKHGCLDNGKDNKRISLTANKHNISNMMGAESLGYIAK
jgi:hypothetical protein